MTYEVAHLDELERIDVMEGLEWRPIRRRFGICAFGVNAYTATKPGDWIVEEHTESQLGHEELYMVVKGRATLHARRRRPSTRPPARSSSSPTRR